MISAPVKSELIDTPTQRIKPASASDSSAGAAAEAPARTESASGTSGAVPYMGHSTFPTKRPRLSATM